jgi:hypothetical protein
MNAKHQFKYTYNEGSEDFSPVDVTFDMPGDVTITQMLWNFQCYLKACGFVFDGNLEVVPEEGYDLEDLDWESEAVEEFNETLKNNKWTNAEKNVKEFNKKLSKLEAEVKKNKWVHSICNPPASDWSNEKNNPDNC